MTKLVRGASARAALALLGLFGVLVAGIGTAIVAQNANVTYSPVGANTVTVTQASGSASTLTTATTVTSTETSMSLVQPVISLTTTTTTSVIGKTTTTITSTLTYTTYLTQTTTNDVLYYQPFYEYWTAYEPLLTRAASPIVDSPRPGDTITESIFGNGSVAIRITESSTKYYEAGFYYQFGTLSDLVTHPLSIAGSSFTVELWLNPASWNWNKGGTNTGFGPTGAMGYSSVTGTQTVGTASTIRDLAGACTGTHTIADLISGACPGIGGTTPFALWVGTVSNPGGTSAVVVNSISSPYP